MKKKFSTNIRILRKENNISQNLLAKEIGYGKSIISDWETGVSIPSAKAVIILSRYFQVSTDYILKLTNDNSIVHRFDDMNADIFLFSKRLKELRLKNKLSQDNLALKTGISQPSINRWEHGKIIPNANAVITLASYFGVTTDYLLGESD